MATIGQALTAPEAGWRRYDDTDSRLFYDSVSFRNTNDQYRYNHTITVANQITIKFVGSKFRFIGISYTATGNYNVKVEIDGIDSGFFVQNVGNTNICLNYEKNLTWGVHTVILTCSDINNGVRCDAVDIDSDGYLINPIPINLTASAGDSKVTLSWNEVTGATGYNVKGATTAGGPYETIATNVSGASYVDSSVVNGTTYYYVVTVVYTDGVGEDSNEASATPVAAPVEDGQALLRVTMTDSSEREYRLPKSEINGFVNWYNYHAATDTMSYAINDSVDQSKEYLTFDKIISFKVIPVVQ
jgi:hypothetical protein